MNSKIGAGGGECLKEVQFDRVLPGIKTLLLRSVAHENVFWRDTKVGKAEIKPLSCYYHTK